MFKSKFNLYNTEWLDLVFSERNKNYGAYDLRKHYNSNLLKSLFFTATLFAAGLFTISVLIKQHHDPIAVIKHDAETVINLTDITPPEVVHQKQTIKKSVLPASGATQKAVAAPAQTMKVVADNLVKVDPKPITAQNATTGLQDIPGDIPALNTPANGGNGTATGTDKPDNGVKPITMLEKLPEFPGGMDAWTKFLSKNLRYPEQASSAGVSGRVYMSFIVEKDGRITDIQVLRAAGYGFDEEAKRVLKMAPQWNPGIQNGRPVRVRYTIPINFTISD
ncbi:energy transducer TonB [Mucilaginibacter arboris]|uniref:TonB family protein n=1 Tax=Mucilaginibacter arboris TaxID=2682090 RepID=A0A7K1T0S7_9SPHI|nr:energy transducer TonB [Mucilaginibacter arboris]MVN23137.1 TonB family protein [Mucilaginibacter arboris]